MSLPVRFGACCGFVTISKSDPLAIGVPEVVVWNSDPSGMECDKARLVPSAMVRILAWYVTTHNPCHIGVELVKTAGIIISLRAVAFMGEVHYIPIVSSDCAATKRS